jgi:hypothetical protein
MRRGEIRPFRRHGWHASGSCHARDLVLDAELMAFQGLKGHAVRQRPLRLLVDCVLQRLVALFQRRDVGVDIHQITRKSSMVNEFLFSAHGINEGLKNGDAGIGNSDHGRSGSRVTAMVC